MSINEELDVQFLKDWMTEFAKDEKCGETNIESWELNSIKITMEEFERKFVKVFPPAEIEYGRGLLPSIAVRNKAFLFLYF